MTTVEDHLPAHIEFPARSAAEYRRAVRHSYLVTTLKFVFPALAIAIVAGFVAVSVLSRALPENISVDRASIVDGVIVMKNPVLTGQADDFRTFTVRAERATQKIDAPNIITLEHINADLPVSDSETARVDAERGVYNRTRETLTLDAPFRVVSSSGVSVDMQRARFDIAGGEMVSDAPVTIANGKTRLVAQSARMRDNGETIVFERGVRMTIDPSTLRGGQQEDGER